MVNETPEEVIARASLVRMLHSMVKDIADIAALNECGQEITVTFLTECFQEIMQESKACPQQYQFFNKQMERMVRKLVEELQVTWKNLEDWEQSQ